MPARREQIRLPAQPESVPAARHFLSWTLQSWGLGELQDAVALAGTEVLTNAVVHARTAFDVSMQADRDLVVAVRDTGPAWQPPPTTDLPDSNCEGGRGLPLIAAVTSMWGVWPDDTGKTVSFRLPLPETSTSLWTDAGDGRGGRSAAPRQPAVPGRALLLSPGRALQAVSA